MSSRNWRYRVPLIFGFITLAGALLRLLLLDERPLHHDEALHALHSYWLLVFGDYSYTPFMHGPLLYYLTSASYKLFGISDFSARLMPVFAGSLLVFSPYFLRRHLTVAGAAAAALLLAISPTFIYYSRFLRHDIYAELLHIIALICGVRFLQHRGGIYLAITLIALTLNFANHELTYITLFLLGLYGVSFLRQAQAWSQLGLWLRQYKKWLLIGLLASAATYTLLFSSFFSNPEGLLHGLPNPLSQKTSLGYWLAQHEVKRGGQPIYYYLKLLFAYEFLPWILFLSCLWNFKKIKISPLRLFLFYWAVGSLLIYSWAGERMPWLLMHSLLPMILLAGFSVASLLEKPRTIALTIVLLLTLATVWISFRLNFVNHTNAAELLVHTQSTADIHSVRKLVQDWEKTAGRAPHLLIDDSLGWPFSWYFRYRKVLDYPTEMQHTPSKLAAKADIVLVHIETKEQHVVLPEGFRRQGVYALRDWWVPMRQDYNPLTKRGRHYLWNWLRQREIARGYGQYIFALYLREPKENRQHP